MLKTRLVLNELVISSNYTPDEIKKLEMFAPEMLEEKNEDTGAVEFVYKFKKGCGTISKYGIMFDTVDNDGKAALKVPVNCDGTLDEKKRWIGETYGAAVKRAAFMEENFTVAIENIEANIADVIANVEVIA